MQNISAKIQNVLEEVFAELKILKRKKAQLQFFASQKMCNIANIANLYKCYLNDIAVSGKHFTIDVTVQIL